MHEEQVGFRRDGEFHCGQTGIHGGGDACDATGVFHLQTIRGAVVVPDFGGAEQGVAVLYEGGEGGFRHREMKAEAAAGENFFAYRLLHSPGDFL